VRSADVVRRVLVIASTVLMASQLGGCMPELRGVPATVFALPPAERPRVVRLKSDVSVSWTGSTMSRVVPADSQWREIGRIPEGQVMRRLQGVFTVEGANTHEAMLVIQGSKLVGFYMTHERAFLPASPSVQLDLTEG
jgi:hypothetical protein